MEEKVVGVDADAGSLLDHGRGVDGDSKPETRTRRVAIVHARAPDSVLCVAGPRAPILAEMPAVFHRSVCFAKG